MLSRVADALFWMSRYLERAETVARLCDVCFYSEIDMHGVFAGPHELQWTSLATILQSSLPTNGRMGTLPQNALSRSLSFDLENPTSIMSCISRARYNARSIRGTINSAVWTELNKLYWKLSDEMFVLEAQQSPHEFYRAVETGSYTIQGICDATLIHNEGWQFIQLGKFLERADKTLRILDTHFQLLHDSMDATDWSMAHLQWAAVLRSCQAYEAYQSLHVGRLEPERVIEFLLLHPHSPRSVLFALERTATALKEIESAGGRQMSKADRILGRVLNELRFCEIGELMETGLHPFLSSALERCAQASIVLQRQYALR
jgi:uncharacterized alpha-E superfamily protein